MLKRAGYSDGIGIAAPNVISSTGKFSDEWWMSKRIARECALGPHPRMFPSGSALSQICHVDFTEIEVHYPGPDLASTIFNISSCGRFLMAAHGCLVYVYELNRSHKYARDDGSYPGLLRPVTSIICPRRVLACSMDTSSQRYAIAILLDGRMGLVCDIAALSERGAATTDDGSSRQDGSPDMEMVESGTSMPLETGPRALYRNLCSEDDPPRSVAICPQRRCVAFGCSSGLELHWVDALTGQDLNRWFPLTAPSDYLFFLPPRKGVDSAKKLRLISSAGRPDERSSMSRRTFGQSPRSSPFWERFGWGLSQFEEDNETYGANSPSGTQGILTRLRIDASRSSLVGRMDCSDHYRATPLSDGYHILFTDPASGVLCLGSDAPVGGPTKLLRKIWFCCPSLDGKFATPVAYTAGPDLSQGVRVVAAYDTGSDEQSIWLFSVPCDIFTCSQAKPASSTTAAWLGNSSSREAAPAEQEWMNWWPNDGLQQWLSNTQDPVPDMSSTSVWPVKTEGQRIGTCKGLVDLAIDSGPHLVVWAFSRTGTAKVWRVDDGQSHPVQRILVVRDGTVRITDESGDLEMVDAASSSPEILGPSIPLVGPDSYDGTVQYDWEGDVVMQPVEEETVEAVLLDAQGMEVRYQTETWTRTSSARARAGFVEELTGVARIDLEIW
ncbi:hypothetical protein LZ554_002267 [Drepanopeziza brunnea f. sp. 'monogermtubi']|nr:hypothetical protein LZ554_002267 [Drepanopeziza brunnea f. sp. 'monogermtubi']